MAKPIIERIKRLEAEQARTEAYIRRLRDKLETKADKLQRLQNKLQGETTNA